MTWLTEFQDAAALRERAMKSLTVPVGLANPMWLAFGAAATAGAAWWLMTRWTRPENLEAAAAPAPAPTLVSPVVEAAPAPLPVEAAAEPRLEAHAETFSE